MTMKIRVTVPKHCKDTKNNDYVSWDANVENNIRIPL